MLSLEKKKKKVFEGNIIGAKEKKKSKEDRGIREVQYSLKKVLHE